MGLEWVTIDQSLGLEQQVDWARVGSNQDPQFRIRGVDDERLRLLLGDEFEGVTSGIVVGKLQRSLGNVIEDDYFPTEEAVEIMRHWNQSETANE